MTVDVMTWTTAVRKNTGAGLVRARRENKKILEQALAIRGQDSDDGAFTHETIVAKNEKLKARGAREVSVVTTWTLTPDTGGEGGAE